MTDSSQAARLARLSGLSGALDVYFIAIGGTGMAPFAALLQELGHRVRGADGPLYPPMSTLLEEVGIEPHVGWDPAHLDPEPDLVVVGNAVPRSNPEATFAEAEGFALASMPEALGHFLLADRKPLVVAGTHGKTTTTSIAAHVFDRCGGDPGYLIGGVPATLPASFAVGTGERFVIEGDEYNAAYFDRGPKFLHYRAESVILTSVEHDHADLYPSPDDLLAAYGALMEQVPASGLVAACGDSEEVRRVAERARCRMLFYGLGEHNDVRPVGPVEEGPSGARLRVAGPEDEEPVELSLQLSGAHNVVNALGVWAVARRDGLGAAAVASALGSFTGVARRLEEVGEEGGVLVIDDFAHHPTAVETTVGALRSRYPGRRLLIAYEPRSLTAGRRILEDAYVSAFRAADGVFLAPIFHAGRLSDEERLDLGILASRLGGLGVPVRLASDLDELFEALLAEARPGDVVATMSSGAFGGLPRRLVAELVG